MTDDELLRYLGATDDHVELTVLVRLERPGSETVVGTLGGPNAWLRTWPGSDRAYAAITVEAMIGLLGPAARLIAQAGGHECDDRHPDRCIEADDIIAAWIEISDTEIDGERFAARDVMLASTSLSRPFEPQRQWGDRERLATGHGDGGHQPRLIGDAQRQLVTSDRKILHWATKRTEPSCLDART